MDHKSIMADKRADTTLSLQPRILQLNPIDVNITCTHPSLPPFFFKRRLARKKQTSDKHRCLCTCPKNSWFYVTWVTTSASSLLGAVFTICKHNFFLASMFHSRRFLELWFWRMLDTLQIGAVCSSGSLTTISRLQKAIFQLTGEAAVNLNLELGRFQLDRARIATCHIQHI